MNAMRAGSLFLVAMLATSCLLRQPPCGDYDTVLALSPGMSYEQLLGQMGVPPYYVKEKDAQGNTVYVFKYRLKDLRRIPLLMKPNAGFKANGQYADLLVTVGRDGLVNHLETCTDCSPVGHKTTVIDFDSLIRGITNMITVTLPAVLVFLSADK
jgi:hypothetical protein